MKTYRPGLTVSILAFLSCLLLLAWFLFSLFAFRTAANDLYALKLRHAKMLLTTFVSQLPDSIPAFPDGLLPQNNPAVVHALALAEDPEFGRLTLLDINDKYIFSTGKEKIDVYAPFSGSLKNESGSSFMADGSAVALVTPIIRNGVPVGKAGLLLPLAAEQEKLDRSRQLFIAYFALDFVLLLGLGSFILSRIVVRPVNKLLAATEKITEGHYGQHLSISGCSELSLLAEAFNTMSERLQQKDNQVKSQVTALEKANSELRQAREETLRSEKMASIGLLAAGMAHEVGTPLSSIIGYAELLESDLTDSEILRDYAARISKESNRIDRIVRGLLEYSRPHSSNIEPVLIPPLVRDTLDLLSQQGALKQVTLSTRLDGSLPPVLADPHQLQQVLINLLLNSRDAAPDDGKIGVRMRLAGVTEDNRKYLCLDVMDNGCGIPEANLKSIFDPFFTTKPPGKGTGLGLAISARIMEGFGGRITVRSSHGKGSCLTMWLPLAEGHNDRNCHG